MKALILIIALVFTLSADVSKELCKDSIYTMAESIQLAKQLSKTGKGIEKHFIKRALFELDNAFEVCPALMYHKLTEIREAIEFEAKAKWGENWKHKDLI